MITWCFGDYLQSSAAIASPFLSLIFATANNVVAEKDVAEIFNGNHLLKAQKEAFRHAQFFWTEF